MKIYRGSFWSGDSVHSFFMSYILGLVFVALLVRVEIDFSCLKIMGMLLVLYAFPVCLLLFSEFYVIELDDALVVRNAICPFWKKKIYFKDVVKISVVYLGGYAVPYMRIIIDKKRACRYYINRVKRKQLPELVDSLRKKGIDEDARGMDMLK